MATERVRDLRPDEVVLYHLEMPLVAPFETSFGRTREREILLLRMARDGVVGWGEAVTDRYPLYGPECNGTVQHLLEQVLVPVLMNRRLTHPGAWWQRVAFVKGNPMAKAAVEMALWDLYGRMVGRSLAELWGVERDRIPVGVSIGIHRDLGELVEVIAAYRERGYQRVKLKIKPGHDIVVLETVRNHYPDLPLMVDANAAYRWPRDEALLLALDDFNLMMIEQPFPPDHWLALRSLQQRIRTPLCLDESVTSVATLRLALALDAGRIINIKQGRVGGLTPARRIHDLCYRRSVPVWCGGMLETGIGRAANVALAGLPGFVLPGDLSESRRYWKQDLVDPEFVLEEGGTLAIPRGPGLGVNVIEARVQRFMTARRTLFRR